jgi:hypothetical protein
MTNLETRLNVTTTEKAEIKEKALKELMYSMENGVGATYTEIFKYILTDSQFKEYKSNTMTKDLCDNLIIRGR